MIEKRDEKFLKQHGIIDWGDFNHPPTPYEICDPEESGGLWMKIHKYGFPKDSEFRQVYLDRKYGESVHLFVWDDVIYMFKVNIIKENNLKYKDIPIVYRVGCKHEYTSAQISKYSDYRATCKKCGYSYVYNCGD
jgi:hypothetical protein